MTHSALPSLRPVLLAAVSSALVACGGHADDEPGGAPGSGGEGTTTSGGTGGVAATGGTGGGRTGGTGGGTSSSTCEVDMYGQASLVAGLNTEPQSNFVGLLSGANDGEKLQFYAQQGVPCEGADDTTKCQADFDALLTDLAGPATYPVYIVTNTQGVRRYVGPQEVLELLGSIDTPNEALIAADVIADCSAVAATESGYTITVSAMDCATFQAKDFQILVAHDGTVTSEVPANYSLTGCAVPGRLTDDLCFEAGGASRSQLVSYLVEAAQFEAAAIAAFMRIESELRAWKAPEHLVAAARRAAGEELEHARVMHQLARARGGRPGSVTRRPHAERSLLDFALENAIEGCVNELFSAACAQFQARSATDPELRQALKRIADDETRHAELSLAIHEWCLTRLTPAERDRVESARHQAARKLRQGLSEQYGAGIEPAGLPNADQAHALYEALEPVLAA